MLVSYAYFQYIDASAGFVFAWSDNDLLELGRKCVNQDSGISFYGHRDLSYFDESAPCVSFIRNILIKSHSSSEFTLISNKIN